MSKSTSQFSPDEQKLWRRYGLTLGDYHELLREQDLHCAICGIRFRPDVPPVVDHCHDQGHVRGLLCSNCNTGLGLFADSPDILQQAINYLTRGTEHDSG